MEEIKNDKKIQLFILLPFILIATYFYFYPTDSYLLARKQTDKMYRDFIIENIKEQIWEVGYRNKATLIELKNGKSYLTNDLYVMGDEYNSLNEAAKKGDSLIKNDSISFIVKKKSGKEIEFFLSGNKGLY